MVITQSNRFRVLVADKQENLRKPNVIATAYRCGNKETALHSAIKDIEAMGDGAVFLIQVYRDNYGWTEAPGTSCGEMKDGRYYPRANF
jgi:hypothetical protein